MANLAAALKEEICRLARKEVKAQVTATKGAVAQHRREIARLKRILQKQEKKVAFLEAQERRRIVKPRPVEELEEGLRFSARSVKAQRRRLKLSAEAFAKLAGVSTQTVYYWEQGKTRPRPAQFAALVAIRDLGRREAQERLQVLGVATEQPAAKRKAKKRRKAKKKG